MNTLFELPATPTGLNPVISAILANPTAIYGFSECAAFLGYSPAAAYVARSRNIFPVRVRTLGQRLIVFKSDLVEYLKTGESQASQSVPAIRKGWKVKIGRPSKRESISAANLRISVKALRQRTLAGGGHA